MKAGKLGYAKAYEHVAQLYKEGLGVERDFKKAKHYYELGAIGGSLVARHNLACLEGNFGNNTRACKHYLICAKAGYEPSLTQLQFAYEDGEVTKDEYAEALRSYQKQYEETKSAMREEASAYFGYKYKENC